MENERNFLLTLVYDGTRYHGFQVQQNALTVCEVFQNAQEQVLGARYAVKGCSRTDAGVHAQDYKLSFRAVSNIPCKGLLLALNQHLPNDIAVTEVLEVPLDFHARYHCIGKQYTYRIYNSRIKDPFTITHRYRVPWHIDEQLLHDEAQCLVGTHDFSAFCTHAETLENPVRTIHRIAVLRSGKEVQIQIEGDGFLYNMVRIIVGTLLSIAGGKISVGALAGILSSCDRQQSGKTVPAHGLYLTRVDYPLIREAL